MAMFENVNALLRTAVLAGVVVIGGFWTWFLYGKIDEHSQELTAERERAEGLASDLLASETRALELDETVREREQRIGEQGEELRVQGLRIRDLEASVQLLKVDHRIGRLDVIEQTEGDGATRTHVRFTELDGNDEPIGPPIEAVVDGTRVYVEALVVKFDDDYVEHGDYLRGTSVCMFKSLFGDGQKPSEGAALDSRDSRPRTYGGGDNVDPFHAELWQRFWDYANDPDAAAAKGVRAIHGEAPFMEVRPGKSYRVELRSSGGLTIRALE